MNEILFADDSIFTTKSRENLREKVFEMERGA